MHAYESLYLHCGPSTKVNRLPCAYEILIRTNEEHTIELLLHQKRLK